MENIKYVVFLHETDGCREVAAKVKKDVGVVDVLVNNGMVSSLVFAFTSSRHCHGQDNVREFG